MIIFNHYGFEYEAFSRRLAGYATGEAGQANYQKASSGVTRHAEVVSIRFDHQQISYAQLLQIFFAPHDQTPLDNKLALGILEIFKNLSR